MSNLTFGIIKPDAVAKGHTGKIIDRILSNGFQIRGMKLIHQSKKQSEGFYAVHAERPFYGELTEFMSSGAMSKICGKVSRKPSPRSNKPMPTAANSTGGLPI